MRSLQIKFSALVVTLLVVASVGLAVIATQHERAALESEVEKRGRAVAQHLAGAAKEPMLSVEQGDFGPELTLEQLVEDVGAGEGVVSARLLDREGRVAASLAPAERDAILEPHTGGPGEPAEALSISKRAARLMVAAPILYSGVRVGEAQVEFDLTVLVDPVVRSSTEQLALAALAVIVLGVLAGTAFVALLVGPLRRLRIGVEQLSAGNLSIRVPPTSRDEVGELTRAFNEMGESLPQKERIQRAFGRYASDYVLSQLLEGADDPAQSGIEREVTVLFVDIRRFTHLAEGLQAPRVVSLLNEIFQLVTDRILDHGGTVDKFIGDSVMAYFGAPLPSPNHAIKAVSAAIEIRNAIATRNQQIQVDQTPERLAVELGIGIHTGLVVVGNIGSDHRTDFTAIGDPVNVAHRLEKLARPGEILVSEAVQRRVRGAVPMQFEGERQLSGREEPVHVYSIQPDAKAVSPAESRERLLRAEPGRSPARS
ncbi:MAG TPA: adenylate/guanylate cyclase domain-containing protein [Myxococcota bacterium]|nr:adenylate/guanylate cyclase domain-containing protein [Myxococcota bacterium]